MKVAYVTHSGVADRQRLFAQELRAQLTINDGALAEIYPAVWGRHQRRGGWFVDHPGDMINHRYPAEAWSALEKFGPDVILLQNEAYCEVATDAANVADDLGIPLVLFSWENSDFPNPLRARASDNLRRAAWNVFGNTAALDLGVKHGAESSRTTILPQVGIDEDLFTLRPDDIRPTIDALFLGRDTDPMKGFTDLLAAHQQRRTSWNVVKGSTLGFVGYADLPRERYWMTRLLAVPSKDVPGLPHEQFAPAVSAEALLCGVPVVATRQEAIHEWLDSCPAAWFAEPGNPTDLRDRIEAVLHGGVSCHPLQARAWATVRFGNKIVAAQWLSVLDKAIEAAA